MYDDICAFLYSSSCSYPIEKLRNSPYPYKVNVFSVKTGTSEFEQYPLVRVYLSSLILIFN